MSAPSSSYRELRPGAALNGYFVCLWAQAIGPGEGGYRQHVLPDGCIDLVWVGGAEPVVVGPFTRDFVAQLPSASKVIGARFRPGSAPGMLRLPAEAFLNRETALRDVWRRGAEEVTGRIAEAGTSSAKLLILERWLSARAPTGTPADPLVREAVRWLARHPTGRVRDLASVLEVSERHLRRRFQAAVGYGPKMLQRVLRLQRTLALAGEASTGLAGLALDMGYADQAHMARETSSLTGLSPTRLLAGRTTTLGMADLFKTDPSAPA